MDRFRLRAASVLIFTWCATAKRISPSGPQNVGDNAGKPQAGLPRDEGDTMMLLQGIRGLDLQIGSSVKHGSTAKKDNSKPGCTPSKKGDCIKEYSKEVYNRDVKAFSQANVSADIQNLAKTDASFGNRSQFEALKDFVTAIQAHVDRRVHLADSEAFFWMFIFIVVIICFVAVLVRISNGNELFRSAPWPSSSATLNSDTGSYHSEAFEERPQTLPAIRMPSREERIPSPVVSTKDFQRVSRAAMSSPPRTTTALQAQAPGRDMLPNGRSALSQASGLTVGEVPPLCSKMNMPVSEARFLIPKHAIGMVAEGGALKIVGLSGAAFFQATTRLVKGYQTLEMSLCSEPSTPCATIRFDNPEAPSGAVIRGEGGTYYGVLEKQNDGSCVVTRDGRTLIFIEADPASLTLLLRAPFGKILATVQCDEHVDIKVGEGNDILLLISCILAVLIQSSMATSM